MAMTALRRERVGDDVMPLPTEVVALIERVVRQSPSNDLPTMVSEVLETMAGSDPNKLLAWMKSYGGAAEFIKDIQIETKRQKSQRAQA